MTRRAVPGGRPAWPTLRQLRNMIRTDTYSYLKRDRADGHAERRTFVHQRFSVTLPRPMLLCRLLGHRPVVDGYDSGSPGSTAGRRERWVECSRCTTRPHHQGRLDPEIYAVGDVYNGDWGTPPPAKSDQATVAAAKAAYETFQPPGPWPQPTGTEDDRYSGNLTGRLGGELHLCWRRGGTWGWELKVGNPGSEQDLAASVKFGPAGGLFLHTERFGGGIVRLLNSRTRDGKTVYESRTIGLKVHNGKLWWTLWAPRDSWSSKDPKWMQGAVSLNPADRLFGRKLFKYIDVPDSVNLVKVRCADSDADTHIVALKLQQVLAGRDRWPFRKRFRSWTVDWSCRDGIPDGSTNDWKGTTVHGSHVDVSDSAVRTGTWPAEAAAAIALQVAKMRTRYGHKPTGVRVRGDVRNPGELVTSYPGE